MNDITKARYYLQTRGSKLQYNPTFGSMLAEAEKRYRNVKIDSKGVAGDPEEIDPIEVDALLDYAALRYLKRTNKLPPTAQEALGENTSLERKRELALSWVNA